MACQSTLGSTPVPYRKYCSPLREVLQYFQEKSIPITPINTKAFIFINLFTIKPTVKVSGSSLKES